MSQLPIYLSHPVAANEYTTFHDLTMITAVMASASDLFLLKNLFKHTTLLVTVHDLDSAIPSCPYAWLCLLEFSEVSAHLLHQNLAQDVL